MTAYPRGVKLIQSGQCPAGAVSPMACMFCMTGHMLECHYPYDCETAQCSHLAEYEDLDEDRWYEESGYPNVESYNLPIDLSASCEVCGCTELQACPGGCDWSELYLAQDRHVCTNCETLMGLTECRTFQINMAALRIWRSGGCIQKEIKA